MTRIDFYVLNKEDIAARYHFAARLCEKALQQGLRTLVIADDAALEQVDEALWQFRPEGFLPHARHGEHSPHEKVLISNGTAAEGFDQFAINLSSNIPAGFSRFERCAEIVCKADGVLETTRAHYAHYKQRGYPINTHNL